MKRPYMKNALTVINELFMNYIIESSEGIQAFNSELYRPKHITYIRTFNQLDPSQTFSHIVTEKDNIPWKRE